VEGNRGADQGQGGPALENVPDSASVFSQRIGKGRENTFLRQKKEGNTIAGPTAPEGPPRVLSLSKDLVESKGIQMMRQGKDYPFQIARNGSLRLKKGRAKYVKGQGRDYKGHGLLQ